MAVTIKKREAGVPWDDRGVVVTGADLSFYSEPPNGAFRATLARLGARPVSRYADGVAVTIYEDNPGKLTRTSVSLYAHSLRERTDKWHWSLERRIDPIREGMRARDRPDVSVEDFIVSITVGWSGDPAVSIDARMSYLINPERYRYKGPALRSKKSVFGTLHPVRHEWSLAANHPSGLSSVEVVQSGGGAVSIVVAEGTWKAQVREHLITRIDEQSWEPISRLLISRTP